ncbi:MULTISPECIES: OmpA family protein [Aquitalea]|uniref:OmpA family protein n=1 Tax=Aquitalea TaxID=407217 RepID=UPI0018F3BA86|nr:MULTISPECIES: OmpA family protein [Aquitalea]
MYKNKSMLRLAWGVMAFLFVCQGVAQAEDAPDTRSMIESLKPLKTRSLRNLQVSPVKPVAEPAAEAAVDSVNLPPAVPAASNQPTPVAAAPLAATPPQAEAAPSLSLAIQFDPNSVQISSASQQALARLASALQSSELRDFHFLIEGHTDAKGLPAYNRKLSQLRADAVRKLLITRGVAAQQLRALGKGSDEPANKADPYAAENRRVRIVNTDQVNP